jgi:CxxC motif-containing protein (DUF1111 family)
MLKRSVTMFLLWFSAGCASVEDSDSWRIFAERSRGTSTVIGMDRSDLPLAKLSAQELSRFRAGDELFEVTFRQPDGVGPLFIRTACAECHREDGRGPGTVTRFGLLHATSHEQHVRKFPFGDAARPYRAAGARTAVVADVSAPDVLVSQRLPPAVFGRGYLDAIDVTEIERLGNLAARRTGAVRGRVARVRSARTGDLTVGRFGLKAQAVDLDEFTARAFQADMGLTSTLYPDELPNPDGLTDDDKPGVDLADEQVAQVADYVRMLALPLRPVDPMGSSLFVAVGCADCHVPELRTRSDYPLAALAGTSAPVYSDLLLHDMGEQLADGVREGDATAREWRTAPLIGLRFAPAFLHDGRAATVEAAVEAHAGAGSEANEVVDAFSSLAPAQRERLLTFVSGL